MNDTVKKALEKVVARKVRGRRGDATLWADTMRDTADDIAEFLNSLDARLVTDKYGTVCVGWFGTDLAEAVLRTSHEEPTDAE